MCNNILRFSLIHTHTSTISYHIFCNSRKILTKSYLPFYICTTILGYPLSRTNCTHTDPKLCPGRVGAGCGPLHSGSPSRAHAAHGFVSQPALLPRQSDTPGAHHQGFRPGVVPSQPQEHHQYPHVQCIAKSMRLAHAGPRRAEQRLQLRTCSCNGYDGDRVYQRPQVTLSNLPINLRIYSLHLKILTIYTCS